MAIRYWPTRDTELAKRFNDELVGNLKDDKCGIIGQEVILYRVSVYETQTNMYGEAVGGKNFKQGVQLACIVEAGDFDYNTDEFGPDAQQDSQFHILRETLLELSLTPEIGDIVEWNYGFFEVNGILENQLIGGMQENNWSVTLNTHLSRQSFSNMSRIRSI